MSSISTEQVIIKFHDHFSHWDLPVSLMINSPYCNGAAENAVKTIKLDLKKIISSNEIVIETRPKYSFAHRLTPQYTTLYSPVESHLDRQLRSRLTVLLPINENRVFEQQNDQKQYHGGISNNKFKIGDTVFIKAYSVNNTNWMTSNIIKQLGTFIFLIELSNRKIIKRHLKQTLTYTKESNESYNDNLDHSPNLPLTLPSTRYSKIMEGVLSDDQSNIQTELQCLNSARILNENSSLESTGVPNLMTNVNLPPGIDNGNSPETFTLRRSQRPKKIVERFRP